MTLDVDGLISPICDEFPGGDPHAYSQGLRSQLSELRNPARSSNPDDPDRDGRAEPIDWKAITDLAASALSSTTKDLRVACHLTEAAMHRWGLQGLRTGLTLLRRLCETQWEQLAPALDPDDPEARCAPLENLLDDPNHGPRLPTALRGLPILPPNSPSLSLLAATTSKDDKTAAECATIIAKVSMEQAVELRSEIQETLQELESFQHLLVERLGDYAPTFLHLEESLQLLNQWIEKVLQPQLTAGRDCGAESPVADQECQSRVEQATENPFERRDHAVRSTPRTSPLSPDTQDQVLDRTAKLRAEAYRQLSSAADVLQRIEPHSPIPYMVHRAVQIGQLPLPQLMSVLVREESTLAMFSRELGLSDFSTESRKDDD